MIHHFTKHVRFYFYQCCTVSNNKRLYHILLYKMHQPSNKRHHHGGAVCLCGSVGSIDKPAPSWDDLRKGLTEAGVEGFLLILLI